MWLSEHHLIKGLIWLVGSSLSGPHFSDDTHLNEPLDSRCTSQDDTNQVLTQTDNLVEIDHFQRAKNQYISGTMTKKLAISLVFRKGVVNAQHLPLCCPPFKSTQRGPLKGTVWRFCEYIKPSKCQVILQSRGARDIRVMRCHVTWSHEVTRHCETSLCHVMS